MEKEKPFLFTDLVPPGEVYIPDESDVIPVRTWSRGDPYAQDADGGFSRLPEKEPVAISVSTDGMLHYSALQTVHDGSEPPMEEDGGEFDDGDNYNDYDDNDDDEEEILPNNGGVKYNDVEEEYDSYQQSQAQAADEDFYETDNPDEEEHYEENENEQGDDGDDYENNEDDFEDEDEEGKGGGEDDDQVIYDAGEEEEEGKEYDEDAGGGDADYNSFEIDQERFEKVRLSPREMDLINSSGEYNDLVEIMNEYNELVDYLASPRANKQKAASSSKTNGTASLQSNKTKTKSNNHPSAAMPMKKNVPLYSQQRHDEEEGDYDRNDDGEDVYDQEGDDDDDSQDNIASHHSLLARNKLNIVSEMVAGAAGIKNKEPNNRARKPNQQQQPQKRTKHPKKKLFGQALEDHKKYLMQQKIARLAEMVEARKKEEELLQREAERAMAKRKKFKEALLEKAMRARLAQEAEAANTAGGALSGANTANTAQTESVPKKRRPAGLKKEKGTDTPAPSFLAPTKAFQVQCVPAKTAQQVVFTDEDLQRQEAEKREQIAAIRRKFKEQHKKILNALKKKNEDESKKLEEEQVREAQLKERRRQKVQRLLSEKQMKSDTSPALVSHDDSRQPVESPVEVRTKKPHPRSAQPLTTPAGESSGDTGAGSGVGAAGSGLAAIRRRTRSLSQTAAEDHAAPEDSFLAQQRILQKQQKEEAQAAEQELKDAMAKELRKVASKEQQTKLTSYLANIAEQRKREEQEKIKKEERSKKRMAILSARLLSEAAERKQMLQNDTWRFAQAQQESNSVAATCSKSNSGSCKNTAQVVHKPRPPAAPAPSSIAATQSSASAEASATTKPPKKVKMTAEMAEKMVARLQSQSTRVDSVVDDKENYSNVPARDFNDWKRKNGVPADGLVFAMTGWYPCVKEALIARGWYFNSDPTSPYFNLKWTLRSLEVSQETLQPWQLTNHYLKNVAITTKAGLIKSLQSLVWTADVEANDIIPRGYDLSNNLEMQAFLDDFRSQKAESVMKALYLQLTGLEQPEMNRTLRPLPTPRCEASLSSDYTHENSPTSQSNEGEGETIRESISPKQSNDKNYKEPENKNLDSDSVFEEDGEEPNFPPLPALAPGIVLENISVNDAVFEAVMSVLEKQIKPYEDSYIDDRDAHTEKMITDLEWELISKYKIDEAFPAGLPAEVPEPVDAFLKEKEDTDLKPTAAQNREKRRQQAKEDEARHEASQRAKKMRTMTIKDLERIHVALCALMHHNKYQTGLNGKGDKSYNMWIVKPAAKSRGRGISTFMDLNKLLKYVDAGTGRYSQWVVQKYMENPLIIANRKFDLRQWVVVTNWNPLTIWFYDECYARFGVEEYSTNVSDLENSFIHLVNNSIGKNSENFNKSVVAENGVPVEGYMWGFDQVAEFMQFKSGQEQMISKVRPRMKDIAKWSLMCASEMIEHRKNSWELYGFDFMVDDEYNAWLIEINSSPACDYSTSVTERYVQKALVELLAVVLDCREWESQPKKSRGECPDTGGWEKIYQGPLLDMPMGAFGTEMSLKGEAYKNLPKATSGNYVSSHTQQVDFSGTKASAPSAMSSKLRASISQSSAQHQTAGDSGTDSPKRQARSIKAAAPVQRSAPSKTSGAIADLSPTTNNNGDDDFDDSDNEGTQTASKLSIGSMDGTANSNSQLPSDMGVLGAPLLSTKIQKNDLIGKSAKQTAAPPLASIPIKVFNVDF